MRIDEESNRFRVYIDPADDDPVTVAMRLIHAVAKAYDMCTVCLARDAANELNRAAEAGEIEHGGDFDIVDMDVTVN